MGDKDFLDFLRLVWVIPTAAGALASVKRVPSLLKKLTIPFPVKGVLSSGAEFRWHFLIFILS